MISVIITVYNKADCMNKCIDSILKQTISEIDIILVDDGSTDNSASIIDDYCAKDSRVQGIHKKNGGETSARKVGLSHAKGEYILFVDADDWIDVNSIEFFLSKIEENDADIVTGDWIIHYGASAIIDTGYMPEGVYSSDDNRLSLVSNMIYYKDVNHNGFNASLNTKVFRKDLISHTLGELPNGIVYAEDDFVTYATLAVAKKIVVTHLV